MGGHGKTDAELYLQWQRVSGQLKRQHRSVTIPISALTSGLARHRALLFKVLADFCQIPCRLLRGQFYTGTCMQSVRNHRHQQQTILNLQSMKSIRKTFVKPLLGSSVGTQVRCGVGTMQHIRRNWTVLDSAISLPTPGASKTSTDSEFGHGKLGCLV